MEIADSRPGTLPVAAPPDFAGVYRAHFGFVWASLRALGVPERSIEDALQDVFVVVHRRLDDFEGRSSVRTWLFGIARRVAFRQRRGQARADRRVRALAEQPTPPTDPEAHATDRLLAEVILRALDELDEDKRTAIVLHVVHDLSGPEIAELLEINVDTAYSRIKAARGRLRSTLGRMDVRADLPAARRALRGVTRPPGKDTRRRMWAALAMRLGVDPAMTVPVVATSAAAGGGSLHGIVVAIAIAIAGAVVLGTAGLTRAPDAPPSARTRPPAAAATPLVPDAEPRSGVAPPQDTQPQQDPEPQQDPVQPPEVEPRAVAKPSPRAPAHAPAAAPPTVGAETPADLLAEEVALLGAAREALDAGRPDDALASLRRHATRFAKGQLTAEREAYRAIAECERGDLAVGRPRSRAFLRAHASSPLAARVRTSCDLR